MNPIELIATITFPILALLLARLIYLTFWGKHVREIKSFIAWQKKVIEENDKYLRK